MSYSCNLSGLVGTPFQNNKCMMFCFTCETILFVSYMKRMDMFCFTCETILSVSYMKHIMFFNHKGCGLVVKAQGNVAEYPICPEFNSRCPQQLLPLSLSELMSYNCNLLRLVQDTLSTRKCMMFCFTCKTILFAWNVWTCFVSHVKQFCHFHIGNIWCFNHKGCSSGECDGISHLPRVQFQASTTIMATEFIRVDVLQL